MKAGTAIALFACAVDFASSTAPKPGSEWKNTLLLDDFTGAAGSAPSSSNWILETGTQYPGSSAPAQWGTGEVESYSTSRNNIRQTGAGTLQITPRKSSSGQWTSARMESAADSFQAPAGGKLRLEANITMPAVTATNGLGYWPSFWALGGAFRGNYTNWPAVGEFDIMENVNAGSTVNQGLHCDINPGGVCNEPDGLGKASSCTGTACVGHPHVYTLVVDRSTSPEQLAFKIDGKDTHVITATQLGAGVWAQTIHHGFYLVLNIAMGGAYPNAVAGVTTPTAATAAGVSMTIDYVAVWST